MCFSGILWKGECYTELAITSKVILYHLNVIKLLLHMFVKGTVFMMSLGRISPVVKCSVAMWVRFLGSPPGDAGSKRSTNTYNEHWDHR